MATRRIEPSERDKEIIRLRDEENQTFSDIAKKYGVNASTIRRSYHDATIRAHRAESREAYKSYYLREFPAVTTAAQLLIAHTALKLFLKSSIKKTMPDLNDRKASPEWIRQQASDMLDLIDGMIEDLEVISWQTWN